MTRKYNNESIDIVAKYINKLIMNLESIIKNYLKIYSKDEIDLLINSKIYFEKIYNDLIIYHDINKIKSSLDEIFETEEKLKKITFKAWLYEEKRGYSFISWLKDDKFQDNKELVFATFSNNYENVFCDSSIGIKYEVSPEAFLGASEIDGATIKINSDESCLYTISSILGNSINSYNCAIKIASPELIINNINNKYQSKHNEIILDARYIKPVEIICLNPSSITIAEALSTKMGIPINYEVKTNRM